MEQIVVTESPTHYVTTRPGLRHTSVVQHRGRMATAGEVVIEAEQQVRVAVGVSSHSPPLQVDAALMAPPSKRTRGRQSAAKQHDDEDDL